MRKLWPLCILAFELVGIAHGDSREEWRNAAMESVVQLAEKPPETAIPELGTWLRKLSRRSYTRGGELKWEVHAAAQEELLAIPGHAEWYRDDILERFRKWEAYEKPGMGPLWSDFERYRGWNFETLKEMPSVETVRVLGEMLGDEEEGYVMESPPGRNLDFWASSILTDLGIESPPIPPGIRGSWATHNQSKLKAWRLWYGQVKAGNRTFRFEGDDMEYTLEGPVRQAVEEVSRPSPERSAPLPDAKNPHQDRGGISWPALAISLLVLLTAGGMLLKARS